MHTASDVFVILKAARPASPHARRGSRPVRGAGAGTPRRIARHRSRDSRWRSPKLAGIVSGPVGAVPRSHRHGPLTLHGMHTSRVAELVPGPAQRAGRASGRPHRIPTSSRPRRRSPQKTGRQGPADFTMPAPGVLAVCWRYHRRSPARCAQASRTAIGEPAGGRRSAPGSARGGSLTISPPCCAGRLARAWRQLPAGPATPGRGGPAAPAARTRRQPAGHRWPGRHHRTRPAG